MRTFQEIRPKPLPLLPLLVISCLLTSPFVKGSPAGDEAPSRLSEALDRVSRAAAGVETLAGKFVQERRTSLLKDEIHTKGRFYFERPDILLWEQTEPERSGFLARGSEARVWKGEGPKQPIELKDRSGLRIFQEHVMAFMKGDFDWLGQRYRISLLSETPVCLGLAPRKGQKEAPIEQILVVFSPELTHAKRVEIYRKDGGSLTRIHFRNTKVNIPPRHDLHEP